MVDPFILSHIQLVIYCHPSDRLVIYQMLISDLVTMVIIPSTWL